MECPIGGPRCSEGYAKGNPALNCSPKSYTTERPSPRSGRGRVRRCGGLTPAAVAPPRGRVRRAGRRPRRARAAPRGKGACKQVRFSRSTDRPSKGNLPSAPTRSHRNLLRRLPKPAKGRGRVQQPAWRALVVMERASTSQILEWTCAGKVHQVSTRKVK